MLWLLWYSHSCTILLCFKCFKCFKSHCKYLSVCTWKLNMNSVSWCLFMNVNVMFSSCFAPIATTTTTKHIELKKEIKRDIFFFHSSNRKKKNCFVLSILALLLLFLFNTNELRPEHKHTHTRTHKIKRLKWLTKKTMPTDL